MKAFFTIAILILTSFFVSADTSFKDKYEIGIQNKLTPLFKSYDEGASLYVDIEFDSKRGQLPLTPFLFESVDLSESGRVKLKSLEITIISSYDDFPKSIMNVTEKILSDYGVKPKYSFVKVSKSVVSEKAFDFGYILVSAAFVIMGIFMFFMNKQRISNMNALNTKLSESIASVGDNISGAKREDSNKVQEIKVDTSSSNHWEEMDIDSVRELIMDCYWCEKDQYANYIWSKLSMAMKKELLTTSTYLVDYISYFEDFGPVDMGKELESYYMKPLNLAHLSNDEVKTMVFKFSGFYNKLSSLRKEGLDVSASEKLDLMSQSKAKEKISIPEVKSESRKLIKRVLIYPKNSKEEIELLESKKLTDDQKKSIVSLHWLAQLPKDTIQDILSSYTAKQIASIWMGSENTLSTIEKSIPSKKMKLVKSYMEKVKQERDSQTFIEVYEESVSFKAKGIESVKEAA